MEPVICFELLFPNLEPQDKIARIAAAGFRTVEFWGWRDKDVYALQAACTRHGVRIANFSGHRLGDLISPDTWEFFLTDLKDAVETARLLECSTLMLLTNELDEEGRVVNAYPDLTRAEKHLNLIKGLREALERTPKELNLVLEPLNTRIDHSAYYLADMATAVSVIEEITDPRLKILCDLYHLGTMQEDLEAIISEHINQIGYFHIADFPGRHEPGTGSADWQSLLRQIDRSGYHGSVGFEYSPEKDSMESLRRIRALWDEVLG